MNILLSQAIFFVIFYVFYLVKIEFCWATREEKRFLRIRGLFQCIALALIWPITILVVIINFFIAALVDIFS